MAFKRLKAEAARFAELVQALGQQADAPGAATQGIDDAVALSAPPVEAK